MEDIMSSEQLPQRVAAALREYLCHKAYLVVYCLFCIFILTSFGGLNNCFESNKLRIVKIIIIAISVTCTGMFNDKRKL